MERSKGSIFPSVKGKKERRPAKPALEKKQPTIKSAQKETNVKSKPAPKDKVADSEGILNFCVMV